MSRTGPKVATVGRVWLMLKLCAFLGAILLSGCLGDCRPTVACASKTDECATQVFGDPCPAEGSQCNQCTDGGTKRWLHCGVSVDGGRVWGPVTCQ